MHLGPILQGQLTNPDWITSFVRPTPQIFADPRDRSTVPTSVPFVPFPTESGSTPGCQTSSTRRRTRGAQHLAPDVERAAPSTWHPTSNARRPAPGTRRRTRGAQHLAPDVQKLPTKNGCSKVAPCPPSSVPP